MIPSMMFLTVVLNNIIDLFAPLCCETEMKAD